ncbi:MAG TPA: PAS domain S-box protein, partial [Gallionella sp.]|nr:PAS domain S-box protein [Gallionella sp.]
MKLFFYPAITLMNRLVYPRKFTLLGLISFIAIAILAGSLFVSLDTVIRTSQRQLESVSLIKPISRAVQLIQQHRGLSAMLLGGKEVVRDRRASKEQEATEAFNALEEKLPADMISTPDWQDIREHWRSLRKEGLNWTVAENFAAHTRLVDQILLFEVVHTQATDVDMFYLVDIAINKLPDVLEHMGRIRAYGAGVLAEKRITEAQKKNIYGMIANLNDALPPLKISFDKAAYHNPTLRSSLSTASGDISNSVAQFVNLVESDILTGRFSTSPEDFIVMATTAIDNSYSQLYESLLPATEVLIRKRIAQAEKVLRISVGIAFLLFLVVVYFSVGIYYAIIDSIQALARSARAFATGDMRERIDLGTHDELKQVGDSFNEMADGFNALLEAHREDEERLRATIETAMDAVVQINAEGTIISWTTQAENIFGWTRSEVIGQALHKTIIPSQYREAHIRGLERFLASGEGNILNSRVELLGLHRDGHEFPIELSVAPIKTAEGYEFSAFIRDITGRKLLEEELKYSEGRFRALMEQSPLSIQIFTPDGRTKSVNRAWENMWGITLEALAQYNVLQDQQLIAKGVMPYIEKAFAGKATEVPTVFYDMDTNKEVAGSQKKYWVRAYIYPLKNAAGDIQEIALIHEDITEQYLAAEQLRIAAATFETQEAILIADADANILRVNHAFEALSGYSEAEIIGQNPRILQ